MFFFLIKKNLNASIRIKNSSKWSNFCIDTNEINYANVITCETNSKNYEVYNIYCIFYLLP